MTSSQTPQTDVGCPNLKDGDEVDADDLVLHLDQVDDGEDQVLQDLTFRLSGKVLDGGPCTPFDPAPLGLAQGEELVSTPVFITAGQKVSPLLGLAYANTSYAFFNADSYAQKLNRICVYEEKKRKANSNSVPTKRTKLRYIMKMFMKK